MNEKSGKRGFQIVIFMTSRRLKGSFPEKIVEVDKKKGSGGIIGEKAHLPVLVVVIHRAARGVDRKGFVMGADFGLIFPDFSRTIETLTLKDTL